jgi:uncharacterized protein
VDLMARLLIFMLAFALAALAWRTLSRGKGPGTSAPSAPSAPSAAPATEAMVRCEQCGLNLPQSDALSERGRWYCSREHLPPRPGGGA